MSQDRIWLKNYPAGVDPDIQVPHNHDSLADRLLQACAQYADRTAISCGDDSLSYAELADQSECVAAWLASSAGLVKGDRIALMCPNILELPVSMLAAHRLGLVVVNVNPLYTSRELRHQLVDSGAVAIVIASTALPVFDAIAQETSVRTSVVVPLGQSKAEISTSAPQSGQRFFFDEILDCIDPVPQVDVEREDLAFLQYTGGMTGASKGAMLSHGNVLSNLAQVENWVAPSSGASLRIITALPLYHIMALCLNELLFLGCGAELVLITNPRDVDSLISAMRKAPPGFFTGVNTLFNAVINHPAVTEIDFSQLHMAIGGGTAILPAVSRQWETLTGRPIVQGYGLSEASPVLTLCHPDLPFDGSIGFPVPATDIEIRDPESGESLPLGEKGELCANGPQVMRGYWGRESAEDSGFHPDGWLRTGDVAFMNDQGAITIVDRTKDMILVSGFNVYPNEIESICAEHPGIMEAACIGVPDERTGEAVKAFVVPKNSDISTDDIIKHCRKHLTAYKVPRQIEIVEEIPKSPVGKILRRELRQVRSE